MDIKLAQKIIATKTLEQVTAYMASKGYDGRIKNLSFREMISFMADKEVIPHRDECLIAQRVLMENARTGKLAEYDCPKCKNKGVIYYLADDGEVYRKNCECRNQRINMANAKRSGMGDLLDITMDDFKTPDPWMVSLKLSAENFLRSKNNQWFALLGQTGAGKTILCAAIANNLLERGKSVVYMPWVVCVKEIKRNANDVRYEELFDRYARCDVLYIDDFFKGKYTDADITFAYELINYRYSQNNLITIISSELYLDDIICIDAAIAGRIKQRCGEYITEIEEDPKKNYRFNDF